jgi:hypothetical protein
MFNEPLSVPIHTFSIIIETFTLSKGSVQMSCESVYVFLEHVNMSWGPVAMY